jgi:6-phosphogluconolactonase
MRTMANRGKVEILDGPAQLARRAAGIFIFAAKRAIGARGEFAVALAGGSTPKATYELLASKEYRDRLHWARVRLYFGDERNVPPDDARSNFGMAERVLLEPLGIDPANIYRWRTELGRPEAIADEYASRLTRIKDRLDLVLLGVGEDGHTASLFPGSDALGEHVRPAVATTMPSSGEVRFTMTFPVINAARQAVFMVTGKRKAAIVKEILEGDDADGLPAAMVDPCERRLIWLLDRGAASKLRSTSNLHFEPTAP